MKLEEKVERVIGNSSRLRVSTGRGMIAKRNRRLDIWQMERLMMS